MKRVALLVAPLLFLAGCSGKVYDEQKLSLDLATQGVVVMAEPEDFSLPLMPIPGKTMAIGNDEHLRVFTFPNSRQANKAAAKLDKNAKPLTPMVWEWRVSPHFYKKSNVIVLYNGENSSLQAALTTIMGKPFAEVELAPPK